MIGSFKHVKDSDNTSIGNASYNMERNQILSTIGGSLSGNINYGAFSGSASIAYASETGHTDNSISFTYYNSITENYVLTNPTVSPLAGTLVNPDYSVRDSIEQNCGDEYINSVQAGAVYTFTVKLIFRNSKDTKTIEGQLKTAILGMGDLEGALKNIDSTIKQNMNLEVTAYQLGGDPSKLVAVIPNDVVSCDGEHMDSCQKVMNTLLKYTTEFTKQIPQSSEEDKNYNEDSQTGYAALSWTTAPYKRTTFPYKDSYVTLAPANPSPMLSAEIKAIREELESLYNVEIDATQRAKELLQFSLLSGEMDQVKNIISDSNLNRKVISDTADVCYNGFDLVVHKDKARSADTCITQDIQSGECINKCLYQKSVLDSSFKIYDKSVLGEYADPNQIPYNLTGFWTSADANMMQLTQTGSFIYSVRNSVVPDGYITYTGNGGYLHPQIETTPADIALIRINAAVPTIISGVKTYCIYHIDAQIKALSDKKLEMKYIILNDNEAKSCHVDPTPACKVGLNRFDCLTAETFIKA